MMFVDRYDDAIAQAEHILRTVPKHPLALTGQGSAWHAKGMYEEWLARQKARRPDQVEALDRGYMEGGYQGARLRFAEVWEALAQTSYVSPSYLARLYAAAGKHDQAFEWLERGFEERDPNMPYLNAWPQFDDLHDDPRFQDLLRRMNLPQ